MNPTRHPRVGFHVSAESAIAALAALLLTSTAIPAHAAPPAKAAPIRRTSVTLPDPPRSAGGYGSLPLAFEPNVGQTDASVHFLARGDGYALFLTGTEVVLVLGKSDRAQAQTGGGNGASHPRSVLRVHFVGANAAPVVFGLEQLPGVSHYLRGADPAAWHVDVPTYARVRYEEAYPGIDVVFRGNPRELEYDFIVFPGADPADILMQFDGATWIETDASGTLHVGTHAGEVVLHPPHIYQDRGGVLVPVSGRYVQVSGHRIGFELDAYDGAYPLIIDPLLSYATYLGGSGGVGGAEMGFGVAVDAAGSAYVAGHTSSADFPTANPAQGAKSGTEADTDAFVLKLDPTGTALVYSTYLGGAGNDQALAIAVDVQGRAHVTGVTASSDFPVLNARQSFRGGISDAFVSALSPSGSSLVFSTPLGGTGNDHGLGIAVDASGSYITGTTFSLDFPLVAPLQAAAAGGGDVFLTKLSADGQTTLYSTYLGGRSEDASQEVAVDASGAAYVTGFTLSADFPTMAPLYAVPKGGTEAFVAKIAPAGTSLVYASYLGGSQADVGMDIAVDADGGAYVCGHTTSTDLPTHRAFQPLSAGGADLFVAALQPSGTALTYATFLGGGGNEFCGGIALDAERQAYLTGDTSSTNFPQIQSIQQGFGGLVDAFVTKLAGDGAALVYSTYLGGAGNDQGQAIAVDAERSAYVTGFTTSTDFPTENPAQPTLQGLVDAFIAKVADLPADVALTKAALPARPSTGTTLTYTLTIDNLGPATALDVVLTDPLPDGTTFVSAAPSQGSCSAPDVGAAGTLTCSLGQLALNAQATVTLDVTVVAAEGTILGNTAALTGLSPDLESANNTATALTKVNTTPLAAADAVSVSEDSGAVSVNVLANDSDGDGDVLTVVLVTQGRSGAVTLAGGTVSYTPAANVSGADSFTYTVSDGFGGSATATVTVTVVDVNDPPDAVDDTLTLAEDSVAAVADVLGNDTTAPDMGETLTISSVTQGLHGLVSIADGGARVTYAPHPNFFGDDAFTYTVDDGRGGADTATVEVSVTPVNDAPVAEAGHAQTVPCAGEACALVLLDGSGSSDIDGDALHYSWSGPFPEGDGTVTGMHPLVTLPLGTSTVTLTVSDGSLTASDTVAVTVTVDVHGLEPPLASLVPEGETLHFPARAFRQGRTLPLKLQLFCGITALTGADVAPPRIAALLKDGVTLTLSPADLDSGTANGNTLNFRYDEDGGRWIYNLSTNRLAVGTYTLLVELPDGRRVAAGFVLERKPHSASLRHRPRR